MRNIVIILKPKSGVTFAFVLPYRTCKRQSLKRFDRVSTSFSKIIEPTLRVSSTVGNISSNKSNPGFEEIVSIHFTLCKYSLHFLEPVFLQWPFIRRGLSIQRNIFFWHSNGFICLWITYDSSNMISIRIQKQSCCSVFSTKNLRNMQNFYSGWKLLSDNLVHISSNLRQMA